MMTASGEETAETGHSSTTMMMNTSATPNKSSKTSLSGYNITTTMTMTEKSSSIQNLPDTVRDALMHMPHSNQRLLSRGKWYEYYTQHTLDLVYEIYHEDFNYFHYNPILVQRPDLEPPALYHELYQHTTTNNDDIELG